MNAPSFDVARLLNDPTTHIVVCCGSGGVGKTTTAASLAVRAAEQGRHVALLTIDPARRLAQSLGLQHLDNTPRPVSGIDTSAGGSLDAMMLDMKRTFDELVEAHATPEKAATILENPFYVSLSSSFAGTQEYMAMEKLSQLHAEMGPDGQARWDLIVVDTPPSRSALDFLDAPERLASFLDGRLMRAMTAPARLGGRMYTQALSAGLGLATGVLTRVLGAQLVADVQSLLTALDTTLGGFRERAERTHRLLAAPGTAFVVVASPNRDAVAEAGYFVDRLRTEDMPLAGVVVNRVERALAPAVSAAEAAAAVASPRDQPFASATVDLLRLHALVAATAAGHGEVVQEFHESHPGVPVREVEALPGDAQQLPALRDIGERLTRSNS